MERFDRQRHIPGWNQDRIDRAVVAVCGRGWLGTFTVWGLASLGVGEILWIGRPQHATDRMARWFLADPCPFGGCAIYDYPFDIEYGAELTWAIDATPLDALVACANDRHADTVATRLATDARIPCYGAKSIAGGWIGKTVAEGGDEVGATESPITALAAAALLVDSVRRIASPLGQDDASVAGPLAIAPATSVPSAPALIVGVGGIGV